MSDGRRAAGGSRSVCVEPGRSACNLASRARSFSFSSESSSTCSSRRLLYSQHTDLTENEECTIDLSSSHDSSAQHVYSDPFV